MTTKSASISTPDHDQIQHWAEAWHVVPCEVRDTERSGSTGVLRFKFPDEPHRNDDKLQEISWEEFFEKFDSSNLELIYQETTAGGEPSNFNKLAHPENDQQTAQYYGVTRS